MRVRLRGLCAICIVLCGSEYCCSMNLDTSMMRPTKPPLSYELRNQITDKNRIIETQWNQIVSKNRIIETQRLEKEKDKKLIETQKQKIEDLKEERKEFKEKIADLEALVQSLQEERKTKPTTSELSRRESYDVLNNSSGIPVGGSYDILNNSNSTLYDEEKETNGYSEFLDGSISPIEADQELNTTLPSHSNKNSETDVMFPHSLIQKNSGKNVAPNIPPPPSAQRNSRENKAHLPPFSADKIVRTSTEPSIPLPPPLPLVLPSLNQNVKADIPPAPPPPPVSPHISEKKSRGQNDTSLKFGEMRSSKDSQKLIESIWAIPRKNLHENLEIEQIAAKIVNIYLKNNPAKINSAMLSYKEKIKNLEERLQNYETQYQKVIRTRQSENQDDVAVSALDKSKESFKTSDLLEIISEISARLEGVRKSANKGKSKSVTKKSKNIVGKTGKIIANNQKFDVKFSDLSQRINKLAIKYFNEINKKQSPSNLKEVGDFVIESVKIADSLSDLENLRNKSENSSKSTDSAGTFRELDKTVKFAFDIIHLGQKIATELDRGSADTAGKIRSKNPSESNTISSSNSIERKCLELSLEYIRNTCRGKNQLSKLQDMRNFLTDELSNIKIPDNREHPLTMISKLPKDMDRLINKIADLFGQAFCEKTKSSYSQFGTLSITVAGNKINPGDLQVRNSENVVDSRENSFRNFFRNKDLSGEFGNGIIELITADRNLCPYFDVLLRNLKDRLGIVPPKEISSKHSKKVSADLKNLKFLCLLKGSDGNILPLSRNAGTQLARLKDRGDEVIGQITSVAGSLEKIPLHLSNSYNLLGKEWQTQTVSDCVDNIFRKNLALRKLMEGNFGFSTENNHIVIEMDEGKKNEDFSLTDNDMFRIIFAVILNRDLISETNSKLFLSNENISKNEVDKMAEDLSRALGKVKGSLEFVISENAFETEELREVFGISEAAKSKFNTIRQLDELLKKIH